MVRRGFKHGLQTGTIYGWNMKTGEIVDHGDEKMMCEFLFEFIACDSIDLHGQDIAMRLWSQNAEGGTARLRQDQTSQMKYPLTVSEDGYVQEIIIANQKQNDPATVPFLDESDDFLAYKAINTTEDETRIIHYGIFRRLKFGLDDGAIALDYCYHYNLEADNRNTEYLD